MFDFSDGFVFFFGFRFLRLSDRGSSAATILVLVLYALLTDTEVPVVRAAVMGTVVFLGRILGRQGDVYNTLGLAALLILVIWPESPWSLSFQLSFGATWAIVRVAQAAYVAISRSLAARRQRGPSLDRQPFGGLVGRAIGHRTTDCLRFWAIGATICGGVGPWGFGGVDGVDPSLGGDVV